MANLSTELSKECTTELRQVKASLPLIKEQFEDGHELMKYSYYVAGDGLYLIIRDTWMSYYSIIRFDL